MPFSVVHVWTDVSEERIISIFRVQKSASEEPAWVGGCRLKSYILYISHNLPNCDMHEIGMNSHNTENDHVLTIKCSLIYVANSLLTADKNEKQCNWAQTCIQVWVQLISYWSIQLQYTYNTVIKRMEYIFAISEDPKAELLTSLIFALFVLILRCLWKTTRHNCLAYNFQPTWIIFVRTFSCYFTISNSYMYSLLDGNFPNI
jgi:hypothetical protein